MSFTWIPFYQAFADKLVGWRGRQHELAEILRGIEASGTPMIGLSDKAGGESVPLTEIDPFSVYASFNRGLTDENRQAIISALREAFDVEAQVPTDFDGIPIADNMSSWFFAYADERKPGDIDSLWELFVQAVRSGPSGVEATTFDRCLAVKKVGKAKLTMGLFWIRPRQFLPLDKRTRAYLVKHGLEVPKPLDWAQYRELSEAVTKELGSDFPALSLAAFRGEEPAPRTRRYWAGGHQFGEGSQLQRFKDERRWEIGWDKEAETKGARGAWERIRKIRVGDMFAIKGFGGRNDLRIHLVGRVESVDPDAGRLSFQPLPDAHLFRGKAPGAPGDGTWFETLVEVSNREAVAAIFGPGTSRFQAERPDMPQNLILFGPPGTGKTWELLRRLQPKFDLDGRESLRLPPDPSELTWFQVIALALDELGPSDVPTLVEHPLIQAKHAERGIRTKVNRIVWGTLQGHTVQSSRTVNYAQRSGLLIFDKMEDGRWHMPDGLPDELVELRQEVDTGTRTSEADNQFFVTFHPSFSYEDFVEGLRPESDPEDDSVVHYPMRAGVFKQACERAVQLTGYSSGLDAFCRLPPDERRDLLEGAAPVGVFIDEINRGNVSRILGELITLLEADKRLGGANEVIVTLPGSRRQFGVPSNLWVIGTMNTADRSVVALDTALRRRFHFRECPPRPELLDGVEVEGVDLKRMLAAINVRIERLRDRDHLIGHAFFMPMKDDPDRRTLDELRALFSNHIVPLLQEYFYDDLGRIGLVLGPAFVSERPGGGDVFARGFNHDHREDFADGTSWVLTPVESLDAAAFEAIYA